MSIVTILYLILWTVLLYYFKKSTNANGLDGEFDTIASTMITQLGIQFSSMLMCLLTIMLSAGAIGAELENGMIHAIISRPIRRFEYVLGKFFGLLILLSIYATILFSAILLLGLFFSLSTVTSLGFTNVLSGWLLYLCVPIAVLCVTLFGSTKLKVVPNGLLMIFVYILGNIGGMVEMIGKYISNDGVTSTGIFISLISPFHILYTAAQRALLPSTGIIGDAMQSAGGLSGSGNPPSPAMYVYILVYALGFIYLSIRRFGKIDIT